MVLMKGAQQAKFLSSFWKKPPKLGKSACPLGRSHSLRARRFSGPPARYTGSKTPNRRESG